MEPKLGEGGKGIVFLCQDTVLGRRVAVKLIKDAVMDPWPTTTTFCTGT